MTQNLRFKFKKTCISLLVRMTCFCNNLHVGIFKVRRLESQIIWEQEIKTGHGYLSMKVYVTSTNKR